MWAWLAVLGLTVSCLGVLWLNRVAWKAWHDPSAFEFLATAGERRYPRRVSRGIARGAALFAAFWDTVLLIGAAQVLPTGVSLTQLREWFGPLLLGVLLACVLALVSIMVVNRPRWLVVPHQRHLTRADLRHEAVNTRQQDEGGSAARMASKGRRRHHIAGRARPGRNAGSRRNDG